jgi:hypothetical protein
LDFLRLLLRNRRATPSCGAARNRPGPPLDQRGYFISSIFCTDRKLVYFYELRAGVLCHEFLEFVRFHRQRTLPSTLPGDHRLKFAKGSPPNCAEKDSIS